MPPRANKDGRRQPGSDPQSNSSTQRTTRSMTKDSRDRTHTGTGDTSQRVNASSANDAQGTALPHPPRSRRRLAQPAPLQSLVDPGPLDGESARKQRTLHNDTNSKICTIPPEVLAGIMMLCTKDCTEPDDRVITLTHVCQQWRQVALSFPHLWFKVRSGEYTKPNKVRAILQRSKSTLLDVEVNFGRFMRDPLIAAQVLKQTSRMRTLAIQGDAIDLACGFLVTPAPFLEQLALINGREAPVVDMEYELFEKQTPSLRELVLHGCVLPGNSPIFLNLTRLCLFSSPLGAGFKGLRLDIYELSVALRSCGPTLERLELRNCLGSVGSENSSWDTLPSAVKLPRLQFAILSEFDFFILVNFFRHVNIAPDVPVNVWNVDINNPRTMLPGLIPLLPSRIFSSPGASPAPSRYLQLNMHARCIGIRVYDRNPSTNVPWYRYTPSDEDHFLATFRWALDEDNIQVVIHNIHHDIPLSDIHTLAVKGDHIPAGFSFWKGLFRNAAQVHHLFLGVGIHKEHLLSIFQVLAPHDYGSSPEASSTLLLPHLTHLHFATKYIRKIDPELVGNILRARAQAGAKVDTVTIHVRGLQVYADSIGAMVV